jgi:hypothetical protein
MKDESELRSVVREAVRAEIAPLEQRLEDHAGRIATHDTILSRHTNELVSHGQMLTKHAEMHTQHAERIIAAHEAARTAKQSSSDLARESREAFDAIGRHMSEANAATDKKWDALVQSNARAESQRAIQTAAINQLISWQQTKWFRTALIIGALVGGALAGYLGATR